jgi:hypothetical protein
MVGKMVGSEVVGKMVGSEELLLLEVGDYEWNEAMNRCRKKEKMDFVASTCISKSCASRCSRKWAGILWLANFSVMFKLFRNNNWSLYHAREQQPSEKSFWVRWKNKDWPINCKKIDI